MIFSLPLVAPISPLFFYGSPFIGLAKLAKFEKFYPKLFCLGRVPAGLTSWIREQFAADFVIHHPVRQFSDLSENRSKSARVRAICNRPWTRRTPSAARIRRIQQNLSGRDLARSMDHRRKFACSWNPANRPDEGRRVRRTPWLRPRIMSATRHGNHRHVFNTGSTSLAKSLRESSALA